VVVETALSFRRARSLKLAIGFAAAMAQAVGRRLFRVVFTLGLLARLAKIDNLAHRLPLDDTRVCC
jgi:hypothetical protein